MKKIISLLCVCAFLFCSSCSMGEESGTSSDNISSETVESQFAKTEDGFTVVKADETEAFLTAIYREATEIYEKGERLEYPRRDSHRDTVNDLLREQYGEDYVVSEEERKPYVIEPVLKFNENAETVDEKYQLYRAYIRKAEHINVIAVNLLRERIGADRIIHAGKIDPKNLEYDLMSSIIPVKVHTEYVFSDCLTDEELTDTVENKQYERAVFGIVREYSVYLIEDGELKNVDYFDYLPELKEKIYSSRDAYRTASAAEKGETE